MSSPSVLVDTVRNVPLIIEHRHNDPMDVDEISGFPFDRDTDRDVHFRTQLDDIARRHPEFAEHLGHLPTTAGVRRQSSLGGSDEPDFQRNRSFRRPFADRFERFGFPFNDFDSPNYEQQFYQEPRQQEFQHQQPSGHSQQKQQPSGYGQQQQQQQQQPSGYSQQQPQQPSGYSQQQPEHSQAERRPEEAGNTPPDPERERNNIQQSNTIDLGQKQEPVNDRSQRSMSAPPPEKGQRFTSSINIPVNQSSQGQENMAQTQPQQQTNAKVTERIIPIRMEGRDEPVIPKKTAPTYSQPHSPFGASPQPETIFGRKPEEFTHFVPRQYDKWHPTYPEEFGRQQRFSQQQTAPPQQQQPQPKGEIPIPVQVEVPQAKQKANQRAASPKPPQPQAQQQQPPAQQKKPLTPLEQIEAIQKDVAALAAQVEQFSGQPKDKQYLYLDEMFTRNLLKLDNVDTQGQDDIRTARKEAIRNIEKTIGILEAKAAANAGGKMEVEEKPLQEETQAMEEVVDDKSGDQSQQQEMEVVAEDSNVVAPKEVSEIEGEKEVENRAVLVETKAEPTENRAVLVEKPAAEEAKMETCEGQESNLAVADAVKKFEENEVKEEKESSQGEAKSEDKKGKKKGKKKAEKKEK